MKEFNKVVDNFQKEGSVVTDLKKLRGSMWDYMGTTYQLIAVSSDKYVMDCTLCVEETCDGCERFAIDPPMGSRCPFCQGERTWCDTCQMWSSYCCEEYGTCQCT